MLTLEFLGELRAAEIEKIVTLFRPGARVLEVGAGTGGQAVAIRRRGFEVEAIEIPESEYSPNRIFPITDYDGRHIPFPDASFDIVFSSNVLEHVRDLEQLHREIKRVLRPGGTCVHVLPTHAWRFWTTLSCFPDALQRARQIVPELTPREGPTFREVGRLAKVLLKMGHTLLVPLAQRRHGERGNVISEAWFFHPRWWRRNFENNGFEIVRDEPMGLHYTGSLVFGALWSIERRARMSEKLGSACHLYELRVVAAP